MEQTKEELILQIMDLISENHELESQVNNYKKLVKFLTKRENKLQQIETMFKNEPIDLAKLSELVKGEL